MERYINVDKTILWLKTKRAEAYLNSLYDCDTNEEKIQINDEMYYSTRSFIDVLKHQPKADVAPITHGHWIPYDEIIDGFHSYGSGYSQCSACKKVQWLAQEGEWKMNFCPSCGTKMDEKGDEHNEPNGNE